MTMSTPRISVIIPTYNRLSSLVLTLESLWLQDFDSHAYEVIVVNDGSTDGTSDYLRSHTKHPQLRYVEIENSGPYVARNRGAAVARGDILAFADDDCRYPTSWMTMIERTLRTTGADALAGAVINDSDRNRLAMVYEDMNRYFAEAMNTRPGEALFVTTNNFSCRRTVFEQAGGFDERFYFGAGDREFAARLIALGRRVMFSSELVTFHHHEFRSVKSFVFHFYRQGRGSYLFYRVVEREKRLGVAPLPLRRYLGIFRRVGSTKGLFEQAITLSIVVAAQASVALGYLSALWEGVTDLHKERSERGAMAAAGVRGTMFGLFSFMTGNAVSSAFGFLCFLIMANALSLADFGIFMVAFSLQAILTHFGNFGLPTSVTRFASEFSKSCDESTASAVLKTGLLLQLLNVSVVALAVLLARGLLLDRLLAVSLSEELYFAVCAALVVTVLYNYLSSVFSVYLRFIDLAVLRMVVSVTRFAAVVTVWLASVVSPFVFFAAFFAPQVVGLVASFLVYRRATDAQGRVTARLAPKLLSYAAWQAASGSFSFVNKHLGALILAMYVSEREVGVYGLGLSLSFVYGVIGATVSTYFIPIGARVRSTDEILPFIRRTLRLALPVAAVGALTLVLAEPVVQVLYGEEKTLAVPAFVLLSIPNLVSMAFVAVTVLFHYFFKPYYITVERLVQSTLFVVASLYVARYGATAVAAVSCIASLAGIAFSFAFLTREFRKRGLELQPRMWRTFGFSRRD
jgi:O-antigen/teichoic acid export membrane protein/glycosyltransferase involved in cell wall biosynthesis